MPAVHRVGPERRGGLQQNGRRLHGRRIRVVAVEEHAGGHVVEGGGIGGVELADVDGRGLREADGDQGDGQAHRLHGPRVRISDDPDGGGAPQPGQDQQRGEDAGRCPRRPRSPEAESGHQHAEPHQTPSAPEQGGGLVGGARVCDLDRRRPPGRRPSHGKTRIENISRYVMAINAQVEAANTQA